MKSENPAQFENCEVCEICEGDCKTIGQVADEFKVSNRTLRFYEQIGLLQPDKQHMKRFFRRSHRERISIIIRYQQAGMSLRQIKALFDQDGGSINAKQRNFDQSELENMIARLRVRRDEIHVAIAQFESILAINAQDPPTTDDRSAPRASGVV
jgi:DNA-binding transcriptional MerR regulator